MKIPLKYNLRSLLVRWVGTLMTAVGIGLTVAIFIVMNALVNGLDSTFVQTGHENHLVVIRQGSLNESNSYFDRGLYDTVRLLDGVARDSSGEPLASGEITVIINHPRLTGESSNVLIRGVSQMAFKLRPEVTVTGGRPFREGVRELIVSESLSKRFKDMQVGKSIHIGRSDWRVVGLFQAGGTAYDSEIWADYEDVAQEWDRPIYSSIVIKAVDARAVGSLKKRIEDDRRIHLQAFDQKEYFREQTVSSVGIKALGVFIAFVMGIGSCFAAMNMMYSAVLGRIKEVGTLRALGFKKRSILFSFLVESVILALIGGVLGCLMALPLHGLSTGTANFMSFSEVLFHFRITPTILLKGLAFAAIVGVLGGILPARRAARIKLVEVLRD
ncbi:MAG: ABC transporter permease [Acidobacteria bacterium]|nr:MAG: ABC transporter permease [Acidobacteriota bacterium]